MADSHCFYNKNFDKYLAFEKSLGKQRCPYPRLSEFRQSEKSVLRSVPYGSKVLYVGAGTGDHLVTLANRDTRILAVEYSEPMIRLTVRNLTEHGAGIRVVRDFREAIASFEAATPGSITLLQQDIRMVEWPAGLFDTSVAFCTLPLMNHAWPEVLRGLCRSATHTVFSIYKPSVSKELAAAYSNFGIRVNRVDRHGITAADGFWYDFIPPRDIINFAARIRVKVHSTPRRAGFIYEVWSVPKRQVVGCNDSKRIRN